MTEQVKLTSDGLTKIDGMPDPLTATLTDLNNNPLTNKDINFIVNSIEYTRTTNSNGVASLNINLPVGTYPATITFDGDSTYSSATKLVYIHIQPKLTTWIMAYDYTKNFNEAGALRGKLQKTDDTPLPNRNIIFTINGVSYTRVTDLDGIAFLNINLPVGEYAAKLEFAGDETQAAAEKTVTVRVKSNTTMKGNDVIKMEDETEVYECAVYNAYNQKVECDVHLKVNGVTYVRHTDENGNAKLNIRLPAGEYRLTADFKGDNLHNPSSTSNNIKSIPYRTELTSSYAGVTYPSNNRGFMESKVIVKQYSPELSQSREGVSFWDDTEQIFHKEIPFESYEITETDPRVKTAKFTTTEYFDLTEGQAWAYIASPYHENFGGRILKVDYDKDKGLYNYQCQDGRRTYMSKYRTTGENAVIYDIIESLIIKPYYANEALGFPITDEQRSKYWKALSGLRPIEDYEVQTSLIMIPTNNMENRVDMLGYDSLMDKIMNLAHKGGNTTDVYFSPEGVIQLDPVDLEKWVETGLMIRHSDLTQYKYGFDTTNIITGVSVQNPQNSVLENPSTHEPFNNEFTDLNFYFGANISMMSPKTTQVVTGNSNSSGNGDGVVINSETGLRDNSGANIPKDMPILIDIDNINGYSADVQYMEDCATALRNNGYTNVTVGGVGPGTHTADVERAADGTCVLTVYGGLCACTMSDLLPGGYLHDKVSSGRVRVVWGINIPSYHANTASSLNPEGRHFDKMRILPPPYDMDCGGFSIENPGQQLINSGVHYVYGDTGTELGENLAKGNTGGSTSSTGTNTTTVVDMAASYQDALDKMVDSTRSLLNFEIKLPLNDTLFKRVHTNQLLWTELPSDFKLANIAKVFKILPTYKVNRGIGYQENRWYIDKMVIKCDANGLFGTLTLNPFPSTYSSYSNAVKAYREAYDQAFRQQTENANIATNTGGGAGEARLGDDSTDTGDIACATGRYHGHAGDNENFDECAKRGYAREGASYFDWARQFNTPIELAKALNDMYEEVTHYNHWDDNAEVTFNKGWGNCWDGCRMVKCCFDAAGFDCIVVTGEIYGWGHGWNAVKWNGRWYTFDLLFDYTSDGDWGGTNTLRMAHEW